MKLEHFWKLSRRRCHLGGDGSVSELPSFFLWVSVQARGPPKRTRQRGRGVENGREWVAADSRASLVDWHDWSRDSNRVGSWRSDRKRSQSASERFYLGIGDTWGKKKEESNKMRKWSLLNESKWRCQEKSGARVGEQKVRSMLLNKPEEE